MQCSQVSRRGFLSSAAATGAAFSNLSVRANNRQLGANERIGVGFIGYGLIGKRHVIDFQDQPDVDMVAVCDAHSGRLDEAAEFIGGNVRKYSDFRKLLDDEDVHAVVVSTPDHWHALMTMMACSAGKDVYVEKPLSLFVREGRWMADVAARNHSVVQVGTQQRSGAHYQRARELIKDGHIGKITSVRMHADRNVFPGFGSPPDQPPPQELDWDMWLGPAPQRPYNPNRGIYHFRWFWDYSGGQMTNLGQHSLDIVDWALGVRDLQAVTSAGGRFAISDNGETPDTQDAIFEFGDWTATWSHREVSSGEGPDYPLVFYGTKGSLGISRGGFRVTADRDLPPASSIPQFTGAHPVGGPQPVKVERPVEFKTTAIEDDFGDGREQFQQHVRNFLDCVKTRETPISDLESGHRVATVCHLANISLRLGRKLKWNAQQEIIVGDRQASAWLARTYRAPWNSELKALGIG